MLKSLSHHLLSRVGNTPLLLLKRLGPAYEHVEVYAKAEWFNPGGSVKDRAALHMIEDGERSGALTPHHTIIDSTSGNTGIAYAMIAAIKGYRLEIVMPDSASAERKRTLLAYGAKLILTDPLEGSDGAIREAHRRYEEDPEKYFMPDQYCNPANWLAHYETTGREIWEQTEGRVTHFVAGVGTGGTIMGTGKRLRGYDRSIQVIGVEPDSGLHGIEGLKHIPTSIVPAIYDAHFLNQTLRVTTDEAYRMTRRLARIEGLFVGPSSGAALAAALRVADDIPEGVIVTVFPDAGDRYLSTSLWEVR